MMLLLRSAVSSMTANAKKPRRIALAGLQFQCRLIRTSRPLRALRITPAHSGKYVTQKRVQSLSELHPIVMVQITSSGDDHGATRSDDDGAANTLG